jgi:hypothetical protein
MCTETSRYHDQTFAAGWAERRIPCCDQATETLSGVDK